MSRSFIAGCVLLVVGTTLAPKMVRGGSVERASGFVLEVTCSSERPTTFQLFFDNGQFWSAQDSIRIDVPAGEDFRAIRFPLPPEPIKRLRLDPSDGECVVRFARIRLLTSDGRVVREISPTRIRPLWQIDGMDVTDGVATIRSSAVKNPDPQLLIAEPLHAATIALVGRPIAGKAGVLGLAGCVVILFLIAFGVVLKNLFSADVSLAGPTRPMIALLLGVVCLVAGERLAWLAGYSSPIPFWDEWAADWLYLIMPLQGGFLDWHALFIPQSEHRIVVTRLLTLGTVILSGEWDPRIGMAAGAVSWGVATAVVASFLVRSGAKAAWIAAVLLALAAAQPFDVTNLFWGGQSQMFVLVLTMVLCFAASAARQVTLPVFGAAGILGVISLGTMGSGFLAPGIAAVICAVRAMGERPNRRRLVLMAMVFLFIAALGFCWRAEARYVGPQYAHSFGQFWSALVGFGAWPLPAGTGWWLLRNGPWMVECAVVARRRRGSSLDWFAIALGAWAMAGDCGLSYARPWMSPPTESRHFSPLFIGLVASISSATALWAGAVGRTEKAMALGAALSALIAAAAMAPICTRGIEGARSQAYWAEEHARVVYPFLESGDRRLMQDLPADGKNPYWNSADLAEILEDQSIWPVFPAELRSHVAQRAKERSVRIDPRPGWISVAAVALEKSGAAIACLGFLVVVYACIRRFIWRWRRA